MNAITGAGRHNGSIGRQPRVKERLALMARGDVHLQLKTRYRDGTTHVVLEPLDLLARLAALKRDRARGLARTRRPRHSPEAAGSSVDRTDEVQL